MQFTTDLKKKICRYYLLLFILAFRINSWPCVDHITLHLIKKMFISMSL